METKKNVIDPYVGGRIREYRKKLGWTLSEMARKMEISPQQIQKYEQGKSRISVSNLYKISLLMSVSCEYFFDGFDQQNKVLANYKQSEKMPGKRKRPLDVLLVEQDPTEALITRRAIEKSSVDVNFYLLHTGKQALKFLKQDKGVSPFPRPELIILEFDTSEEELAILREFKRDRRLSDIPVIVLANSTQREDMIKSYRNNASGFIRKPLRFKQYCEYINLTLQYWSRAVVLPQMDQPAPDPLDVELAKDFIGRDCVGQKGSLEDALEEELF